MMERLDRLSLRTEHSSTLQSVCCLHNAAHDDVYKMRDLLVEAYDYTHSKITVLVDDGIEGHSQPTRVVILEAIQELVKDVKAGGHLYFYYSGNSIQIPDQSNMTEDGMNTCLITSDGLNIIDNELHTTLVQPLPSGSRLVAVLDTSHSGLLLGLEHFRCNRVYVPWVYKGYRNSEEIRNTIVRGNARLVTISRTASYGRKTQKYSSPSPRAFTADGPDSKPTGTKVMQPRALTLSGANTQSDTNARLVTIPRNASPVRRTHNLSAQTKHTDTQLSVIASSSRALTAVGPDPKPSSLARLRTGTKRSVMRLRTSILTVPPRNLDKTNEQPDPWILPDEERLIQLLRDDPHQSLKDVLVRTSHGSYSDTLQRHGESKTYKQKRKAYAASIARRIGQLERTHRSTVSPAPSETQPVIAPRRLTFPQVNMPRPQLLLRTISKTLADLKQKLKVVDQNRGYDMVNFQNPELSSSRPLDMDSLWIM
ncbi:Metacaspase type II [Mycena sanguinolenta]|uniref:Metacaspase type II n=1 Tax=Mycena sanguinolenta TaxID=230812 RepID=A0A8H7D6G1_9AGAR|nr:Metacaspase type II [Mycena sanguinolenta]